jgi:hypothetical protein
MNLFRVRLISRDQTTAVLSDESGNWYSLELTVVEVGTLKAGDLVILSEERMRALVPIQVLN